MIAIGRSTILYNSIQYLVENGKKFDAIISSGENSEYKHGLEDFKSLAKSINVPVYDFKTHTRKKETIPVTVHHIVILEGILVLMNEEIRNLMDIKLFVDTADDIRMIRRMKRDINKRKRTFESVVEQYYKTVRPMHIQFVEPTKLYADIIIPEGGKNLVAIDIIRTKILSLLLEKRKSPQT